jgi:hypothetical protein
LLKPMSSAVVFIICNFPSLRLRVSAREKRKG